MAKYAKLENDVVVQIQPYFETGFESCPDNVVSGYIKNGANWDAPVVDLTPTINQIKAEAHRRIEVVMPVWMVAREVSGGTAITQTIKDYAADIRTDSATLEGTLPTDYMDDSHWTAPP